MSFDDAVKLFAQLAAQYKGTYQEHMILKEAIEVIQKKGQDDAP